MTGNPWYRAKLHAMRADRGNVCAWCPTTGALEFAHVRPTKLNGKGRGLNNRVRDIMKHPTCYILLCRSCHADLDGFLFENETELDVRRVRGALEGLAR
jgi:hypothetical protein